MAYHLPHPFFLQAVARSADETPTCWRSNGVAVRGGQKPGQGVVAAEEAEEFQNS